MYTGKTSLPGGSLVKNLPAVRETRVQSLDQEDALEEKMPPSPVFLSGEFHEPRSLAGYIAHEVAESDT